MTDDRTNWRGEREERGELHRLLAAERAARTAAEHGVEWLDPLRRSAAEALTALSLDSVLRDALQAAADLLGADSASVLVATPDGSELFARAAIGLAVEIDVDLHIRSGEGFAGTILASGQPRIVDDLRTIDVRSPVLRSSDLRSVLGVPLASGGSVLGVMHVGSRRVARYTEADVPLLQLVADPLADAIARVRFFESERALRRAAEITASRLAVLQRITAALASARSVMEVCQTIIEEAFATTAAAAGSPEAAIWMLADGHLRWIAGGERSREFPEIPLDSTLPAAWNLAEGTPLFVEDRADLVARWPRLASTETKAFAGFPLVVDGSRLGVMSVGYLEDHTFDESERAFLTAVAEQAALALDRAGAAELQAAVRARREFLAEASLVLTNRYATPDQMLQGLVDISVPRLADWCLVLLRRRGRFVQTALAHDLGELPDDVAALIPDIGDNAEAGPALEVFLSGRAMTFGKAGEEAIDHADLGDLATKLGLTSAMLVPLDNHGRTLGVMAFAACGTHSRYRREDLDVARELATRAAELVDDLAQRERDRTLAETLTRALLPTRLPELPDVEITARYVPAESGPVGGDWYDAFDLADGRLALVVGDVGGHGVEAASTMARLRNGLFAYSTEGHDPATTFDRLSALLAADSGDWNLPDPLATVLFSALDRTTWTLHTACAGHPPWILLRDGRAATMSCGGRVLAAGLPAAVDEREHQLQPGDVVMFLTDGMVERSDEDYAASTERLVGAMEAAADRSLDELCDHALEATTPPLGRRDDCCLLAFKITAPGASAGAAP